MTMPLDWLKSAFTGLRRHSAIILDGCGFPVWFVRWYCKPPKNWGALLEATMIKYGLGSELDYYYEDDDAA